MFERRRYERVGFLCKVTLAAFPNGAPVAGQSIDLSLGGVGIMTQAAWAPGQLVIVSFFLRDESRKEVVDRVTGRVANLKADLEANRIGVEFFEPLQEADQPLLVSKLMRI